MNELVMYNNDLNSIVLPESFTDTELRVFFAVVSRLRDKGSTEVTFSYSYLKEITKEKRHFTKDQYSAMIQGIYHKIIGLRFAYKTDQVVGEVNLFQSYEKSLTDESFTISVSPKFQYIFNELTTNGSFTAWNLSEFCDLPGVYTKQLYRLLKQWKYVGSASFLLSDLRKYMGAPEKYATKDITRRVINPAVKKLSENAPEFKNLTFDYSNKKNKAYRVKFKWTPEKRVVYVNSDSYQNMISKAKKQEPIETTSETTIHPEDFKNDKGVIQWGEYIKAVQNEAQLQAEQIEKKCKKEVKQENIENPEWLQSLLDMQEEIDSQREMPKNLEEDTVEFEESDNQNIWTLEDFEKVFQKL